MENEIKIINKLLPEFEVKKIKDGELLLTGNGAKYYIHIEPLERRFQGVANVIVSKEIYLVGDYWTPSDIEIIELTSAPILELALKDIYLDWQSKLFEERSLC